MTGHERAPAATETGMRTVGPPAGGAPSPAGLAALATAMGNRAFASAIGTRAGGPARLARGPLSVARQQRPDSVQTPLPAPLRALAEDRIAPELRAVAEVLRGDPPPTPEGVRRLRARVAAARELFDTVVPPKGIIADNWFTARSETAIARTLIDGLLNPESDALLRLAWGKTLGTCRQLVGILAQTDPTVPTGGDTPQPAPSPNPLPPPPPPPLGSGPPVDVQPSEVPPSQVMELEVCPRIEEAIGTIPRMMASDSVEEIKAVHDEFEDVPDEIVTVAQGHEFGSVAAVEFDKGLELVFQATLPPPEQLVQIAELLEGAAEIVTNLEEPGNPDQSASSPPPPAPGPVPSPNPLPPPPPPPR